MWSMDSVLTECTVVGVQYQQVRNSYCFILVSFHPTPRCLIWLVSIHHPAFTLPILVYF